MRIAQQEETLLSLDRNCYRLIGSVCVPWVAGWSLYHPSVQDGVRSEEVLTRNNSVLILESLPYNESSVDSLAT